MTIGGGGPLPPASRIQPAPILALGLLVVSQAYLVLTRDGSEGVPVPIVLSVSILGAIAVIAVIVVKAGQMRARSRLLKLGRPGFVVAAPQSLRDALNADVTYRGSLYPLVVFDDDAVRFPAASGDRSVEIPWRTVQSVDVGVAPDRVFVRRAIIISTPTRTYALPLYGRPGLVGFRPLDDAAFRSAASFAISRAASPD